MRAVWGQQAAEEKRTPGRAVPLQHVLPSSFSLRTADYMALPVSQYSVLDARRIERLSETTFRCYVDGVRFFSVRVDPVVTVAVAASPAGPTVTLLDARLEGSPTAVAASDRFDVTMTNAVRWAEAVNSNGEECVLSADTTIELRLDVPRWFAVPLPAVERVGTRVMQRVLDMAVPRFLGQLAEDYGRWAAGDERRV